LKNKLIAMITRRSLLKSLGLTSLALPGITGVSLGIDTPTSDTALKLPSSEDPRFWASVRDQFMLNKDTVFFNPGTFGAMPKVVVDRMVENLKSTAMNVADWDYKDDNTAKIISGYQALMFIRAKVARILNCDPKYIAMTDNVTAGMSYIANGITLQPGDEIVTSNQEHGGGKSSWLVKEKRVGAVYKEFPLPKPIQNSAEVLDIVIKSFTPRTKVLMLSHMITGSGAILPMKEICEAASKRGIFTVVDGAQCIGHIKVDIDEMGCDAYVGCFHKWIGAPAGTAFMYIKPDKMKDIWSTVASGNWNNHEDEGYRFTQRGTGNFSVIAGLDAALDFHLEVGPDKVYERIKFLGDRLREGLRKINKVKIFSPIDNEMCAGITVYNIEGWTGPKLQDEFWNRARMRPRASGPEFGVRHCTHIFNSPEEIDKALEIVKQLAS
jgi:isopenicillin-N epimerase